MEESGMKVKLNGVVPARYKSTQHHTNKHNAQISERETRCDVCFVVFLGICITFALSSSVALFLAISMAPVVHHQGVVITDSKVCTDMGLKVMEEDGSSVDCALVAALCLAIVHPHSAGIGGGGVILVYDRRNDEGRVIDFRETAPSALKSEMLQKDQHVLEKKPGLLVAVPGMLSGLHKAHQLHGRLTWKRLVTSAAKLARNGTFVSRSLAGALSTLRAQDVSKNFRKVFMPNTHAPPAGYLLKQPNLAALLEHVADHGIGVFYSGTISKEIASEVQAQGGVLTVEDLKNYVTVIRKPLQSIYKGSVVLTAPPPHAGAALISTLSILKGLNLTDSQLMKDAHYWFAESLKAAYNIEQQFGDDSSSSDQLSNSLRKLAYMPEGGVSSSVIVMGQDDLIVSLLSSLNRSFGSRIMTSSGILLNSQILDFSWPNKMKDLRKFNPRNRIQAGKRPLSFLTPTVVKPLHGICGTYLALASSDGVYSLSAVTQVLVYVLSFHMTLSDSVARGRLHLQQSNNNTLLVDSEFTDEAVRVLQSLGYRVDRVGLLSIVQGAERVNDFIRGVTDPRSKEHFQP